MRRAASDPVLDTSGGRMRGARVQGTSVFKGIPYARMAGRFAPAAAATPWSGVRDATEYGPRCPQLRAIVSNFSEHMPLWPAGSQTKRFDEECFTLNVWTPRPGGGPELPVLVWIHGGGYFRGSGQSAPTNGANLARRGESVVVTVNHRLGPLGYLHLADLMGDQFAGSGNLGNLDLVLALEWVRDNIAGFGGDPRRVMIFGCSGGGCKSVNLIAMPAARGLFHRVAVQSGPAPLALTTDVATEIADRLLFELGISHSEPERLRDIPVQQLLDAVVRTGVGQQRLLGELPAHGFAPVVDGVVLSAHPLKAIADGAGNDVPLLIGWSREEVLAFGWMVRDVDEMGATELAVRLEAPLGEFAGRVLEVYRHTRPEATAEDLVVAIMSDCMFRIPSLRLVEARLAGSPASPSFVYEFGWRSLDGHLRPVHTSEVPFVFDNLSSLPEAGAASGQPLATSMSTAWSSFGARGVPVIAGQFEWPAYDMATRLSVNLTAEPSVESDARATERQAWDGVPLGRLGSGRMVAPPPASASR